MRQERRGGGAQHRATAQLLLRHGDARNASIKGYLKKLKKKEKEIKKEKENCV